MNDTPEIPEELLAEGFSFPWLEGETGELSSEVQNSSLLPASKLKVISPPITATKLHAELRLAQLPSPIPLTDDPVTDEKVRKLCVATMDLRLLTSAEKLSQTTTWRGAKERSWRIIRDELESALQHRNFDFFDTFAEVWEKCGIAENPATLTSSDEETQERRELSTLEIGEAKTYVRSLLDPARKLKTFKQIAVIRYIEKLQNDLWEQAHQRGELVGRAPTQAEIIKGFKGSIDSHDLRKMLSKMGLKKLLSK